MLLQYFCRVFLFSSASECIPVMSRVFIVKVPGFEVKEMSMTEMIILILNVNRFLLKAFKTLPFNQKRENCGKALSPRKLLTVRMSKVAGASSGNGIKLLCEQPDLPDESEDVEQEQQEHPSLSPCY